MNWLSSDEIRRLWIEFFEKKDHLCIESVSLIPKNDLSLLWINSGVAGLKDYFLGTVMPPSKRLVNVQKSLRTNDIESVGVTSRHHSFFEMLGNFSLGDYFKVEAIEFAHQFLTEVLKLPQEKIYITYFEEDQETFEKWKSLGYTKDRLIPGTRKTNFWDMGVGPCGPNTEMYFDRGEIFDTRGKELLECDIENDRFIEIWNIVFSQFNNDGNQNYTELNTKNIDTGAGLERIASILQNTFTNFETDLFMPIIRETEKHSSYKYDPNNYFVRDPQQFLVNKHFKIIADHMRAVCQAIGDGEPPSATSRGHIIRRLIRRAMFSVKELLGTPTPFLHKLVDVVNSITFYKFDADRVRHTILEEEKKFIQTMARGEELLNNAIASTEGEEFSPEVAFTLYETHGFPLELTSEIVSNHGFYLDFERVGQLKEKHANVSRTQKIAGMKNLVNSLSFVKSKISSFVGYEHQECDAKIMFLANQETQFFENVTGSDLYLILDQTSFYATSGGQHADEGIIVQENEVLQVVDVFKDRYGNHVHKVSGTVKINEKVKCFVNRETRMAHARNHSATHLLFSVLRKVFKLNAIKQEGSDINKLRLTFDFPLDRRPTEDEIQRVEDEVNGFIALNKKRVYVTSTLKEAKASGVVITAEEEGYADPQAVRVVEFRDITKDLCGGTHVEHTGLIESFKIVSVKSKGANVWRVTAVTSHNTCREFFVQDLKDKWQREVLSLTSRLGFNKEQTKSLEAKLNFRPLDRQAYTVSINLLKQIKEELFAQLKNAKRQQAKNDESFEVKCDVVNDKKVCLNFQEISPEKLRNAAISVRQQHRDALIILVAKNQESFLIVLASLAHPVNEIFEKLKEVLDKLRGGGSEVLAQGSFEDGNYKTKIEGFIKEWRES